MKTKEIRRGGGVTICGKGWGCSAILSITCLTLRHFLLYLFIVGGTSKVFIVCVCVCVCLGLFYLFILFVCVGREGCVRGAQVCRFQSCAVRLRMHMLPIFSVTAEINLPKFRLFFRWTDELDLTNSMP